MYDTQFARKTEVVSLRMPSDRIDQIKQDAKKRKISFNALANIIFDEYFDFDIYARSAGYMTLPKKTVRALVDTLDDGEIVKIAEGPTKSGFIDLIYMMKGKFTLQSALNTFLAWIRNSHFTYIDRFENDTRIITVNHNMGKKWSLLLQEVITTALSDLPASVKFEIRMDVLIIRIREGPTEY